MKIRIREKGCNFSIVLPTRMIFSKTVLRLVNGVGRKYAPGALSNIPPEAMEAIFAELCRIKKKYGSYELVDIESADGEMVKITL